MGPDVMYANIRPLVPPHVGPLVSRLVAPLAAVLQYDPAMGGLAVVPGSTLRHQECRRQARG